MARAAKGGGANNPEFRRQHTQLKQQIQLMQQEHERIRLSLSDEQRNGLQQRMQAMERQHERVQARMQEMERELEQSNPDPGRVRKHARNIDRAAEKWQKQHRGLVDDMGAGE